MALLSVRDTGMGIAPRTCPHLSTASIVWTGARSRAHGGTGLGLAIVQSIAESYGGGVSGAERAGQGGTFTVCYRIMQELLSMSF